MKKKLSIISAVILMMVANLHAFDLDLVWDASPPSESVTGYRVYQQGDSAWTKIGESTVPTYALRGALAGQSFRVTAYNAIGEGVPSASVTVPAGIPAVVKNLKLTVTVTATVPTR